MCLYDHSCVHVALLLLSLLATTFKDMQSLYYEVTVDSRRPCIYYNNEYMFCLQMSWQDARQLGS